MTAPATPEAGAPGTPVLADPAANAPVGTTGLVQPAPSPANMPQHTPPAQAAAEPTPGADSEGDDGKAEADAKLRKENASWRTKLREEQQARAELQKSLEELKAKSTESDDRWSKLAAFFNPEADAPPDPETLAAQFADERAQWDLKTADYDTKLSAADQKIRELTIRAALPTVAAKAKAHPDGLLKVLVADGVLGKLDPTADTFAADLESAANEAVEQNPYLKVTPAATRSGAEIPGRSGGSDQLTREQVEELAKKDPAALVEAQKKGRLRNLGIS